jgi:hypothetical protein
VFGQPARGNYRVEVANCVRAGVSIPFQLTVVYEGNVIHQVQGISLPEKFDQGCGRPIGILDFTVPP